MAKVKLSKAKTAIIIIAAIVFALLVAGGIYCVEQTKAQLLQLKRQQRIRTSLSASGKAKNRRDYPLMYFMMTERMILICLQLIFQANKL